MTQLAMPSTDPFKSISAEALLSTEFPPREMHIDPWLRAGETALIWAGAGVGKTMLTLTLAIAMSGGGKVSAWSCPMPKRVLIVDGEMHQQDLQERIKMLSEAAVDGLDKEAMGRNLQILSRQAQDPDKGFYDVTKQASQKQIRQRCNHDKIDVLILDNLTTIADGLRDENDAAAFRTVQSFLLQLKAAGLTTILVHHSKKNGQDFRGSSALLTTFEVVLGLQKPPTAAAGKASFQTNFTKFRAAGSEAIQSRIWTLDENRWEVEEDPEDALTAMVSALESGRFSTQKELAAHCGMSEGHMSRRLGKAVAHELITREEIKDHFNKAKAIKAAGHSTHSYDDAANEVAKTY